MPAALHFAQPHGADEQDRQRPLRSAARGRDPATPAALLAPAARPGTDLL